MSCEEKRIGQAEEELELVMREYGHVPLTADEIKLIAIDECKEVLPQDAEKVLRDVKPLWWGFTDHPLPGYEFIQTESSDWLARFAEESGQSVDNP